LKTKKNTKWQKKSKVWESNKKIKHNKLGLNEEIKNHKNFNKKAKEKMKLKEEWQIWKDKLELKIKLKINKNFTKRSRKKIKTIRTESKKIIYAKVKLKN